MSERFSARLDSLGWKRSLHTRCPHAAERGGDNMLSVAHIMKLLAGMGFSLYKSTREQPSEIHTFVSYISSNESGVPSVRMCVP